MTFQLVGCIKSAAEIKNCLTTSSNIDSFVVSVSNVLPATHANSSTQLSSKMQECFCKPELSDTRNFLYIYSQSCFTQIGFPQYSAMGPFIERLCENR
jgi:hypothetical protein